jgi:ribose transport system ATP-binding protein
MTADQSSAASAPHGARIEGAPVLDVRNLSKTFAGTKALDGLNFSLMPGEIHAVVGQNGSGKSTLIKVLAGFHRADGGANFALNGDDAHADQVSDALRFVHQDLGLIAELSAAENLALRGTFAAHGLTGFRRQRWEAGETRRLLRPFGLGYFDVTRPVAETSMVERTIVALAAAVGDWHPTERGVLVLDEPTAVLPPKEARLLLDLVKEIRATGASVIYVSHRLDEVVEISDRVTILRNGRRVATRPSAQTSKAELIQLMVGADVDPDFSLERAPDDIGAAVLEAEGIAGRFLKDASFKVHEREVLGIVGLPDSGRDELPRLLADGPSLASGGRVRLQSGGNQWSDLTTWRHPGIVLLPPDRSRHGVVAEMSGTENLSLSALRSLRARSAISRRREGALVSMWVQRLGIMGDIASPVQVLSGGNQQKVVLARCLATNPEVLLLCDPTAGVDVGARQAIYEFIGTEVDDGLAVIVASSDISDIQALCSRVLVLREGVVAGELIGEDITELALVRAMEGLGTTHDGDRTDSDAAKDGTHD